MKDKLSIVVLLLVGVFLGQLIRVPLLESAFGDIFSLRNNAGTDVFRVQSTGHTTPGTDSTSDLGTSTLRWRYGYFDELLTIAVTTTTATPSGLGAIVRSDIDTGDLYIATGTAAGSWEKVGAQ